MSFTLGSDPEFIFKKDGAFYRADEVFGGRMLNGKLGTDGHPQTGEIRPGVFKDAISMTNEIQKQIRRLWLKIKTHGNISAHAGSVGGDGAYKPLCGHIHFGIKRRSDIERMLPYMGVPMLMLLFIEDFDENVIRRRQTDLDGNFYGGIRDYRVKPHGFEYRCPSSWLISPALTKGYLSLYHALVHDFIKGKLNAKHPLTNIAKLIDKHNIDKAFRNAETNRFRYKLKTIVRGIKELTMYKQNYKNYQPYINTLLSLMKNGKTWNENRDIFETWNVKDKEIEQKTLFNFQTKDFRIKRVVIPNLKLSNPGNMFPIKVFGLKKKTFNISTNDERMIILVNEFKKNYGDRELVPNLASLYNTGKIEFGIGRELRENSVELVQDLLKYIKSNYKQLIKK